jgi:dCTP deaminase
MSILSDKQIKELCTGDNPMLSPFVSKQVKYGGGHLTSPAEQPSESKVPYSMWLETEFKSYRTSIVKLLSYGVSSYGYDATLASKIYVFTNQNGTIIDPRKFSEDVYVEAKILKDEDNLEYFILPPNSYALGYTNEYFKMPRDVTAICLGKSTYARVGIAINATPIEAGWEGQVVLELANLCSLPIKVYINQGIAQFLFFRGEECETSYADRGGKYQGQTSITLAKV